MLHAEQLMQRSLTYRGPATFSVRRLGAADRVVMVEVVLVLALMLMLFLQFENPFAVKGFELQRQNSKERL